MRQDMRVPTPESGPEVVLRLVDGTPSTLRRDRLTAWAYLVGVTTDEALARAMGINVRHLRRARTRGVGEKFMARAVRFLRTHQDKLAEYGITVGLDELFEVTDKAGQ